MTTTDGYSDRIADAIPPALSALVATVLDRDRSWLRWSFQEDLADLPETTPSAVALVSVDAGAVAKLVMPAALQALAGVLAEPIAVLEGVGHAPHCEVVLGDDVCDCGYDEAVLALYAAAGADQYGRNVPALVEARRRRYPCLEDEECLAGPVGLIEFARRCATPA